MDNFKGIVSVFGTRDHPVKVKDNSLLWQSSNLVSEHKIKETAFNCQCHSSLITVPEKDGWPNAADGMVSCDGNLALGILTADCVPILAFDPRKNIIGAAHAGWRGTVKGVLENLISKMSSLGADSNDIHLLIGPHIQVNSFQVGEEVKEEFLSANHLYIDFFKEDKKEDKQEGKKYLLNLKDILLAKALASGLLKDNIQLSKKDTYANNGDYFSYRRSTHQMANQDKLEGTIQNKTKQDLNGHSWRQISFIAKGL